MRLLVFTQKIDRNDPVLGFFHSWVIEFSGRCETIEVICLEKGIFDFPKNVTVYSLGKEGGIPKWRYITNLYRYLSLISGSYDRVFVHMNQEYILLAGIYWKIKGIPVYMWRNHPAGSFLTKIAIALSKKVFCTSKSSFTAKFPKTVIMPAGIDTNTFRSIPSIVRKRYSVCMVGRISPIKHIDKALESVNLLLSKGVQVSLDIIGPVLDRDLTYMEGLKKYVQENNMGNSVSFHKAVSPYKLPEIYSSYEICLNLTDSGSFDKTVIEASGCGAVPLVSNSSFSGLLPDVCITSSSKESIAQAIEKIFDPALQLQVQNDLRDFVSSQSLSELTKKLFTEIK